MLSWGLTLFPIGLLAGAGAVLIGVLVGLEHGAWWGWGTAAGVLALALGVVDRVWRALHRQCLEVVDLWLWSQNTEVEHLDPTAADGVWYGSAANLMRAYRRDWTDYEIFRVLRELKRDGRATGHNPDTGERFTIVISKPTAS